MTLAEYQRALAASLVRGRAAPEGCDARRVERASRGLAMKRSRAARHLLPALVAAEGTSWRECFTRHVHRYAPCGLLFHVDDAWEFALAQARSEDAGRREAARADLRMLRRYFVRSGERGPHRIRERTTLTEWIRRIRFQRRD